MKAKARGGYRLEAGNGCLELFKKLFFRALAGAMPWRGIGPANAGCLMTIIEKDHRLFSKDHMRRVPKNVIQDEFVVVSRVYDDLCVWGFLWDQS